MTNASLPKLPSEVLDNSVVRRLRSCAAEAERIGALHVQQWEIIYEHKWLRQFVPAEYGGLASSLPDAVQLEEALAWTDGSTAWVVTLCSGANWFAGFLDPAIAKPLFANARVCLAGSGQIGGTAVKTEDGFIVTGSWEHASGALQATAFTGNARVVREGIDEAEPEVLAFLFLPEEVTVNYSWKAVGMIATASHGFTVRSRHIPANRCFRIEPRYAVIDHPLYRYPFLQLAEVTLAANLSGLACRFLELCEEAAAYWGLEDRTFLEHQKERYQQLRNSFYSALNASWQTRVSGRQFPSVEWEAVSSTSRQLAIESRRIVDELYPLCGLRAANPQTEINRVWRNLHTASQHGLLRGR